jgi:hypothetical protein
MTTSYPFPWVTRQSKYKKEGIRSMNSELQEQIVDQVVEQNTVVEFSPAQQQVVQARLDQQKRVYEAEAEAIRAEARRRVSSLTGESSLDEFVVAEQRRETLEAAQSKEVGKYFGPRSSGALATALLKSDKPLYDKMRAAAVRLGYLAR